MLPPAERAFLVSTGRGLLAGRYRIGEVLGRGGMGEVRRAWDTAMDRPVAVKVVRGGAEAVTHQRFAHEVRTLSGLEHPGVVSVFDAGTDGSVSFVVMRLVEGRTLRERLEDGPLPVEAVRALGRRLADALDHVHAHGIVHRDVKPGNVLLDERERPHLADFGLARVVDSPRLTRSGHVMGTAAYLAPEQVRGGEVTPATDIYALGLVLLECLTGRREFGGDRAEAAIARLHRPPLIPADLPADLTRLLALMTSLVPHRRPTAAMVAHALHDHALPAAVDVPPQDRHRARWRWPAFVMSVTGPLAAAVAALIALPGDRTEAPTLPSTTPPSTSSAPHPTS